MYVNVIKWHHECLNTPWDLGVLGRQQFSHDDRGNNVQVTRESHQVTYRVPGPLFHGGNKGDCLHAPRSMTWCP